MNNIKLILENKEVINTYLKAIKNKEIFRCNKCGLISDDKYLFSVDRPMCRNCRNKQLYKNK